MADILIRCIEMPKEYGRCMVIFPDGRVTTEFGSQVIANAVAVPDHGRLVDADILLSAIKKERDRIADTYGKNDEYVLCLENYAMNIVSEATTVIPASEEVKDNGNISC